ncbi:amylo-alpha-1,6-glucosidase [Niastella koreensis]|uniref:Amylo-alpha-16-glucosidase n=2 Tax=Niastella koreensis TaxID=354356 RepID=G8TBI5_NIAKG|nr:amylo-alpha-1,6-glucosidase [Niastella koreensis]AEV97095.1 Amylo-alpha-16-glucosidase [Niastella koreensis GR20-10]OQP39217.1 amylo-alpha-1,6-glucosidase [Niastella koreensis]
MKKHDTLVKLHDDKYYILASSSYADDRVLTLNYGDTFAIFDRWGDIKQFGTCSQGIYHQGTRFISDMELEINHYRPMLLSSNIKNENEMLSVDLTNPDISGDQNVVIPKGTLHISRSKFLQDGACHELIILYNYGSDSHEIDLELTFDADFRDIFEVRGMERKKRGKLQAPFASGNNHIVVSYTGLDNIERQTNLHFDPAPAFIKDNKITYRIKLAPQGGAFSINCTSVFTVYANPVQFESYFIAYDKIKTGMEKSKEMVAEIFTDNEQFNNWINRSKNDLLSLLVQTPFGSYPYAGVPWYNTVFGRDGTFTALETLWVAPNIAKGVLLYQAARQATKLLPLQDAEPGKILHEIRSGEMAETGEIPFKLYYGSIDTTPLFIVLAGQYLRRTDDIDTIRKIWENILNALTWIKVYGDMDGDGFVEYQRKAESGLANQGWKDSHDSISHENGDLASFPIALCEVQGYVYDAKIQAAYMAQRLGNNEMAEQLTKEASELKKHFNEVFWDEQLGTYILALDGDKKPCRVVASNVGHLLYSGIATTERAAQAAKKLMNDDMFNGWGVRTLSSKAARFNPMSYHNGSVWPHDTAIAAYGMARYGMMEPAMRLMQGLFDASLFIELQRLPELFCGFPFRQGEAPTAYPVACSPQAWSVAAVFLLLQACLSISFDGHEKKLTFYKPVLPDYLKEIRISNLRFGNEQFELDLIKYEHDLGIHLIKKPEGWEIVTIK